MRCSCRICWGPAFRRGIYGGWEDISCEACGRYHIYQNFLQDHAGKVFDVECMRLLLADTRAPGRIPIVTASNGIWRRPFEKNGSRLPGWPMYREFYNGAK